MTDSKQDAAFEAWRIQWWQEHDATGWPDSDDLRAAFAAGRKAGWQEAIDAAGRLTAQLLIGNAEMPIRSVVQSIRALSATPAAQAKESE